MRVMEIIMKVSKVEVFECEDTEVYDIGVEHNHNFYIFPEGSDEGVLVHNCHAGNASCYSRVLASLKMKYRFGLTATPKRKDCFTAGHKVRMSDGSLKNIEDIEVGDSVVAWDHERQIKVIQPIVQVHQVVPKKRKIKITHEHGTLICTEDHQIWSETRQCYVNAIDLTTEDVLKVF